MIRKLIETVGKLRAWLSRSSHRWWYLPLIAFLAGIDLFIAIIPTDAILISSVLIRPRRWVAPLISVTLGSTFGALGLAALGKHLGVVALSHFALWQEWSGSETWTWSQRWLEKYGAPALSLIAAGPTPQQPAVLICALSPMTLVTIAGAVFVGRAAKYAVFAWISAYAPGVLKKLRFLSDEIRD